MKHQLVQYGFSSPAEMKESTFHESCFFNLMVPRARSWSLKSGAAISGFKSLSRDDAARIEAFVLGAAAGQKELLRRAAASKARKLLVDAAKAGYARKVRMAIAAGETVPLKPTRWVDPLNQKKKRSDVIDDKFDERERSVRSRADVSRARHSQTSTCIEPKKKRKAGIEEPKEKKVKPMKKAKARKQEDEAIVVAAPVVVEMSSAKKTHPKTAPREKATVATVIEAPVEKRRKHEKATDAPKAKKAKKSGRHASVN